MNNKIPKELAEKQEQQRQHTINAVKKAIDELSAEGHKITIKLLIEYTGLSRSVFGKAHIKAVLREHNIGGSKETCHTIKNQRDNKKKLSEIINNQNTIIEKLKKENVELKEECELLRGKIFEFMQK